MTENTFAPYTPQSSSCAQVPNASCIQPWRNLLLVGRHDGFVAVLKGQAAAGSPNQSLVWKPQSVKRLGRQVLQLAVSHNRSLLFSLTDEGVNLYSLPQLLLKGQAARSSGASCFAWDDATNQLAVAVKKRVILYEYDGLEFVYTREFSATDQPVAALQFLGTTVFVASKKEYSAVMQSGTTMKLKPVQDQVCGFAVGQRAVLVTAGRQSILVDESGGAVAASPPITWSESPLAVAICQPHVIALIPSGLEVQLLEPRSSLQLIQRIELEDAGFMCVQGSDGAIFAASGAGRVTEVTPISAARQAEQLLQAGAFEDALVVCKMVPEQQEITRGDLEARIRLANGRQLLSEKRYEEAMLNLGMSYLCDPVEVLCAFPFLVPQALLSSSGAQAPYDMDSLLEPSHDEIAKLMGILTPYLLSYRSRLASGAGLNNGSGQVSSRVRERERSILIDTALLNAFLVLPDNGALLQFIQRPNNIDLDVGSHALLKAGRYAELVELYKARGRHSAALGVLENLTAQHRGPDVLEVPAQGAAVELRGLPGVWAAVRYLTTMSPPDFRLISTHAKWILERDCEAGIDMFANLYPEVDPSVVLPILSPFGSELAASYLSKVVAAGAEEKTYSQDLAMLYMHQVLDAARPQDIPTHDRLRDLILRSDHLDYNALLRLLPPKGVWEIRAAVFERLERHLEALRIYVHYLHALPLAEAYCDRIASKQPHNILQTLPFLSAVPLQGTENVYALLVQVMLEQEDPTCFGSFRAVTYAPEDERWKDIAFILSKRGTIEPVHALSLLPGQVPLSSCWQFLQAALRAMSEDRRKAAVLFNLYRARHLTALFASTDAQQRSLNITQDRACWMCHKRLGAAAMVRLPDGSPAHYSCYRRSNLSKKHAGN